MLKNESKAQINSLLYLWKYVQCEYIPYYNFLFREQVKINIALITQRMTH